jgi:hypothetical protein
MGVYNGEIDGENDGLACLYLLYHNMSQSRGDGLEGL